MAVGTDADLIQAFADKHASFAEVSVNPTVKVDGSSVRFTVSRNALRGAPSGTSTGIGTFATSFADPSW